MCSLAHGPQPVDGCLPDHSGDSFRLAFAVLSIASAVVHLIAFFAVLFTGRYPAGMCNFVMNVWRWWLRLEAYVLLLTDDYPPFELG